MGLSFAQYLVIQEIFCLDHGRVLSLAEALNTQQHVDPKQAAADRIDAAKKTYPDFKPKAYYPDDVAAACAGLKPAAIIQYLHHPESPAAAIVADAAKKRNIAGGETQAELLKHGIKVRPDFHIVHMHLFYGGGAQIIVGGKEPVIELQKLLHCQYYLDLISSPDHANELSPEQQNQIVKMARGQCNANCSTGGAGMSCRPLHKEIGLLLGYPEEEVEAYIKGMEPGFDHVPEVPYPAEILPSRMTQYPRKPGFHEHLQ